MTNNPIDTLSDNNRRKVITFTINLNRAALMHHYDKDLSEHFPGFRSYKKIPIQLIVNKLMDESKKNLDISFTILKIWFEENKVLRETISAILESLDYSIIPPDFENNKHYWKRLRDEDVMERESALYFYPKGVPIQNVGHFEATFMAFLLGWSTNSENISESSDIDYEALMIELNNIKSGFKLLSLKSLSIQKQLNKYDLSILNEIKTNISLLQENFESVKSKIIDLSKSYQDAPITKQEELNSVGALENLLLFIIEKTKQASANNQKIKDANNILDQVLALTHISNVNFEPLHSCQEMAQQLKKTILDTESPILHPEVELLLKGTHVFSGLLKMVNQQDEIDDDRFADLENRLTASFGKQLCLAAVRGKLVTSQTEVPKPDISEHDIPIAPCIEKSPISETSDSVSKIKNDIQLIEPMTKKDSQTIKLLTGVEEELTTEVAIDSRIEFSHEVIEKSPVLGEIIVYPEVAEEHKEEPLYSFTLEKTSKDIANFILENKPELRFDKTCQALIWRLIYENKLGIAFHLARSIEIQSPNLQPQLKAWIIRAATIGHHVRLETGGISEILKADFANLDESCFATKNKEWNHAVRFLLASAALPAALLAPRTDASNVLHQLHLKEGLRQLYEYCKVVADYGDCLTPLDPTALKKVKDEAAWRSDLEELRKEVDGWYSQASLFNIVYVAASKVWRKWLEPKGVIHTLLNPIRNNNIDSINDLRKILDQLSSEAQFKKLIEHTDRNVIGRRLGDDIVSKPYLQLQRHTQEAMNYVRRWIRHQDTRPGQKKGFLQTQAENLRKEIWERQDALIDELETFEKNNQTVLICGTIATCKHAVQTIRGLFDPDDPFLNEEPDYRRILNGELLKIPVIFINDEWEPEDYQNIHFVESIIQYLSDSSMNWNTAFDYHVRNRNHEATGRIVNYLEWHPDSSIKINELKAIREKGIRELRETLKTDIVETRAKVERAVAFGYLRERERLNHTAAVENIENDIQNILNFQPVHDKLSTIRQSLDKEQKLEIEQARKRIDKLIKKFQDDGVTPDNAAFSHISDIIESGDILTANEYIDMVEMKQPIPQKEIKRDVFTDFFHEKAQKIYNFMVVESTKPEQLIKKISSGHHFCGLKFSNVPKLQTKQAVEMLNAWFEVKGQRINDQVIRDIINNIGFRTISISNIPNMPKRHSGRQLWLNIKTEIISDRNLCPIPTYGSSANGNYRILCVWERPSEEDLLNEVGDTSHTSPPVIVFYFGHMQEEARRNLAKLCREWRRTVIVIDDALMIYLSGERTSRLHTLFNCTLPFTFIEPYTITAGHTPSEMFYGRRKERESIVNPTGSCFIYGGRQLGKTALLRHIERNFHKPEEERIALWIDLKTNGIGYDRSIDEIWLLLAVEFKKLNVITTNIAEHSATSTVLEHIENWLNQNMSRRILLLLDEADTFLENDGRTSQDVHGERGEFIRASRLKGLMDRTNRRFKVVFAGLHNVQRTTRLENHPLAHYGEPLCIGPLLNDGEWREARSLIEAPLNSIGYNFESPDLITRILSQTNYYPSLIQLFCTHLLRHELKVTFDSKITPPFTISSREVEDAYQNQELRKAIRDRFMWTLDLDPRYRVIAFSIAHHSISGTIDKPGEAFSVATIRDLVLTWWHQGFQNCAYDDSLRSLLDEMVGLGVLRVMDDRRYSLRSPNVVSLMGTQDEIEDELLKRREAPIEYEPANFRSALRTGGTINRTRRSPLTAQQESELRERKGGFTILFGAESAGINEIKQFIEALFINDLVIYIDKAIDIASFTKTLDTFSKRERWTTALVLVPSMCPWSEIWIDAAAKSIKKLKLGKESYMQFIFVADPHLTWQLTAHNTSSIEQIFNEDVSAIYLKPWNDYMLRQWLDDCNLSIDITGREQIKKVTGNWPLLLYQFHDSCKSDLHRWQSHLKRLELSLKDKKSINKLMVDFGLDKPEVIKVFSDLLDLGTASVDDVADIIDDIPRDIVEHCLRYGEILNLLVPLGNSRFQLNPLVAHIIEILRRDQIKH